MLKPYRRHLKGCPHRSTTYRRCTCPLWVGGYVDGRRIRKSLDTRYWKHAEELVLAMMGEDGVPEKVSVALALERFLADCRSRGLGKQTIAKYGIMNRELVEAWGTWGIRAVMTDDVAKHREGWTLAPLTAKKKLERLRTFFQFCVVRGWIKSNPAVGIKAPRVVPKPTMPFTDAEIEKILWATEVYPAGGFYGVGNRARMRAFVLLLLNTGLRLQDAVTVSFDRISENRLLLYTQKTGTPVHIPLPPVVLEALEKAPFSSNLRPFWSGQGDPRSATKDWQRSLRRLFKLAGIEHAHAHRFRDTFASRLLVKGVPLGEVSILLGHSNTNITQKHYAPWIRERQERLEELVKRTWA